MPLGRPYDYEDEEEMLKEPQYVADPVDPSNTDIPQSNAAIDAVRSYLSPEHIKSLQDAATEKPPWMANVLSFFPRMQGAAAMLSNRHQARAQGARQELSDLAQFGQKERELGIADEDLKIRQAAAKRAQDEFEFKNLATTSPEGRDALIQVMTRDPKTQQRLKLLDPKTVYSIAERNFEPTKLMQEWDIKMADIQNAREQRASNVEVAKINQQNALKGPAKLNEKMATEYGELQSTGGFANDDAAIASAREVLNSLEGKDAVGNQLEKPGNFSGPFIGNLPDAVRDTVYPESSQLKEQAESVVLPLVKKYFPGATSNWEAGTALKLVYNPRLKEHQNAKKMQDWINKVEAEISNRKAAFKYFEDNNFSMEGYKGPTPDETGAGSGVGQQNSGDGMVDVILPKSGKRGRVPKYKVNELISEGGKVL